MCCLFLLSLEAQGTIDAGILLRTKCWTQAASLEYIDRRCLGQNPPSKWLHWGREETYLQWSLTGTLAQLFATYQGCLNNIWPLLQLDSEHLQMDLNIAQPSAPTLLVGHISTHCLLLYLINHFWLVQCPILYCITVTIHEPKFPL